MKFTNEKEEIYCKFDVEMSDKEKEDLIKYAWAHITDDELANFAINDILKKSIKEQKLDGMQEMVIRNGKKTRKRTRKKP